MSPQRWQSWMALLPCERCGWHPDDCPCRAGVPASAPPKQPVDPNPAEPLPVLTLAERRSAYAPLTVADAITDAAGRAQARRAS